MEYSIPGHDVLSPPFTPPSLFHRRARRAINNSGATAVKTAVEVPSVATQQRRQSLGTGGAWRVRQIIGAAVSLLHKWRLNKQYRQSLAASAGVINYRFR